MFKREREIIYVKKPNANGEAKEYSILVDAGEFYDLIDKCFMEEYDLPYSSFKELYNDGFLKLDYDELQARYQKELEDKFEFEIEEQYKEELEEEKEFGC